MDQLPYSANKENKNRKRVDSNLCIKNTSNKGFEKGFERKLGKNKSIYTFNLEGYTYSKNIEIISNVLEEMNVLEIFLNF